MTSSEVREKFLKFFEDKKHARILPARLVLDEDKTTLFTSSGMQPLIPYLLGEVHPSGVRLVDSQPCFRSEDVEEVGDNRHTTFFEMLGNWSLGDYFKEEQISWFFEFLTKELLVDSEKLHVSVFEGNDLIPKDEESFNKWKNLGISEERIHFYGVKENWWSRSGTPDNMPVGEIGGPDTEVFYEFTEVEHDPKFGGKCHPNCDCGRFLEIGNSVFIQYKKVGDGEFVKLDQQNVDFGGGVERLTAAANGEPDIFKSSLHFPIIEEICQKLNVKYDQDEKITESLRIIADHTKAATFLTADGVLPSNKLQGYVLRRLIRRAAVKLHEIDESTPSEVRSLFSAERKAKNKNALEGLPHLVPIVFQIYHDTDYFKGANVEQISQIILDEIKRFQQTLSKGLAEIGKMETVSGKQAFDLYQSYGFPPELTEELLKEKGLEFDKEEFRTEFEKHRELSRTGSAGMFKGGLSGHGETETKYHTATHLLHQALRDVLGPEVFQKGSNINPQRLRFDFSFDRKLTEEEIKKVEEIVNQKIGEDLEVDHMMMSLEEAKKMNAIGLFNDKYSDEVSIYAVGPNYTLDSNSLDPRIRGGYYSAEFCGGPHVEKTGVIGKIEIIKEEAVSQGVRRIYAKLI